MDSSSPHADGKRRKVDPSDQNALADPAAGAGAGDAGSADAGSGSGSGRATPKVDSPQ